MQTSTALATRFLRSAPLLSFLALGCARAATEPCVPAAAAAAEAPDATVSPSQAGSKAAPAATPQPVLVSLASWRDGVAKQRIQSFVHDVADAGSPQFLAPEQRIAVFDNDGTLWSEQPLYFQFVFAVERVRGLLDKDPVLAKKPWDDGRLCRSVGAQALVRPGGGAD